MSMFGRLGGRLLGAYEGALLRRPIATKCAMSVAVLGTADACAQRLQHHNNPPPLLPPPSDGGGRASGAVALAELAGVSEVVVDVARCAAPGFELDLRRQSAVAVYSFCFQGPFGHFWYNLHLHHLHLHLLQRLHLLLHLHLLHLLHLRLHLHLLHLLLHVHLLRLRLLLLRLHLLHLSLRLHRCHLLHLHLRLRLRLHLRLHLHLCLHLHQVQLSRAHARSRAAAEARDHVMNTAGMAGQRRASG